VFKFFRLYNKVILVIGGCVLMVAFLIPQAVEMFGPQRMQQRAAIGTAHGEEITRGESSHAAWELEVLSNLPLRAAMITDDPLAWLLIQRDAQDLGLYASDREVELALQAVGLDETPLAQLAQRYKVTPATIAQAVRRLLVSEQYRQLVTGTAYRDPRGASPTLALERLQVLTQVANSQMQGIPEQLREMFAPRAFQTAAIIAAGTHRLSTPMLEHFVQDNYTTLEGRFVLIPPDTDAVEAPSEEKVAALFEQYKDDLPGAGEPFPFGYRYPDRVKLTYLRVPMDQVVDSIEVDYVDVLDAYKRESMDFVDETGQAPATPSPEAAAEITDRLQQRRAQEKMGRITAQIQSMLAESLRGQTSERGYFELPADYEPLAWEEIIAAVIEEHGVTPEVTRTDDWVAVNELTTLPGIGSSSIGQGRPIGFAELVSKSRELSPEPELVPQSQRTQVGVASLPLAEPDGDRYLYRLTAAESSHAPERLDEVREQVVEDARAVAAFEKLEADVQAWRTMAVDDSLDAVAAEAGVSVQQTGPFQKVFGNQGEAPTIPGLGASRPFVDAAFALVENLEDPTAAVDELPPAERVAVTPLRDTSQGPALAVFVIDEYQPMTRAGFARAVERDAIYSANGALVLNVDENPLSREALAARTGFDLAAYDAE
jgi:hypothetical protein